MAAIAELTPDRPSTDRRRAFAGLLALGMAAALFLVLAALGAPTSVMVLGAVGVVGLGVLTRPVAATLLFIAILYLNIPVVAVRFHGAPDLVAVAAPLLLAIPFMSYLVIRRERLVVTPTLFWMIGYLVVLLLSTMTSGDPIASALVVGEFATEGLVLYLLMTNAVRTWSTLRGAIVVLLVVGTFLGGLSMLQEVTQTYENQYWGFAQTKETDPTEPIDEDGRPRLSGPIGSKNRYAQAMLVLLPLALFAYLTGRTRTHRILAAISGVAILAGMLLTFSRGAGVALGGLVVIGIAMRYIRLSHAVIVTIALVAAMVTLAPQYLERLESVTGVTDLISDESGLDPDGAILGRATSNLASLQVFVDHPVLGVGPGQYVTTYSQEVANELGLRHFEGSRRAHNLFLEVAADTGVPGVIAFAGIFGATLMGLWRVRRLWLDRGDTARAGWATAFALAVIGYMLTAVFLHLAYMRYFWLLMALANSAIWILRRDARESAEVMTAP